MKRKLLFTITLAFLLNAYNGFSQETGFLKLRFDIKDTLQNLIEIPIITVFENGKKINKPNANPFSIKLENNKIFTIEVSTPFLGKKIFLIDTKVEEKALIYSYKFHVILDNTSTGEKPVAKIFLKEDGRDFTYILLD